MIGAHHFLNFKVLGQFLCNSVNVPYRRILVRSCCRSAITQCFSTILMTRVKGHSGYKLKRSGFDDLFGMHPPEGKCHVLHRRRRTLWLPHSQAPYLGSFWVKVENLS